MTATAATSATAKRSSYIRFSLAQRIEHFVLILSFTILGLTGLPQKFALSPVSQSLINAMGGIEAIRIIHRIAAAVFLIEAIYHVVVLGYKLYVRREEASMMPTIKDGKDAIQAFRYNLGMTKEPPKMPRFNFAEKAEYWAMIWGLFVMAVTGFMLWNPIATTNVLPGQFIPAAKVAHGGEGLLAVLAIILWHFWHVHIRHFNKSMFTGRMDRHSMAEEHGEELHRIESNLIRPPAPPEEQRKRLTIYVPVASLFSLVAVGLTLWFLTFEETSLTTIPPVSDVPVFSPATPTPGPTEAPAVSPAEAGMPGWEGDLETVFAERCASCHGSMGGFSAETYEGVIAAINAGDPDGSLVVQVQVGGDHPGMFTEVELERVIAWIQAGAPEQGAGGAAGDGGEVTFSGVVGSLFDEKCASCHGSMGGYSAETYEGVMAGVSAGDPDASLVIQLQSTGDHPGQFSEEELQVISDWIAAGAPE